MIPAFCAYRFRFQARTPVRLPHFAGSAWRGAFGHALRRTICVMRGLDDCRQCLLYRQCAFPKLFAPPRPPALSSRYGALPPPFVFAPQQGGTLEAGDAVDIELRLLTHARSSLPFVIYALRRAAANGMGTRRGKLNLVTMEQWTARGWRRIGSGTGMVASMDDVFIATPPPCPSDVRVDMVAPLRLKQAGRNVTPETLSAGQFLMALVRRMYLLSVGGGAYQEPDWGQWRKAAAAVQLFPVELSWQDLVRRSSRQGLMRAGGIVGTFILRGDLAPFWKLLWYGQWLHVGHLACMGLGAYRLQSAKLGKAAGARMDD